MEEQKILEPTQLNAMIEKLKVAREDDTPHAVYGNGGEIAVVGDANKTDVKTIDIEVFNGDKWMEICSVSKRNDFDEENTVLEIAFGLDRLLYNYSKTTEVFDISVENLLT